jgi:DNA-binding NarL/FixJ family response regulator
MTTVALVDDHELLRTGLAAIVNTFEGYKVLFEASNGKEFIASLKTKPTPDIILLDITMPVMDGYETAAWVKLNLPGTKILVLSMLENEGAIIRMLKNGARGYILKDSNPKIFRTAMNNIRDTGYYINDLVSNKLMHYINQDDNTEMQVLPMQHLSDNELCFLKLICTDKTYREIAEDMSLSPRTIDTYRDNLFKKLQIKTRTGLAIFAIRNGLIDM